MVVLLLLAGTTYLAIGEREDAAVVVGALLFITGLTWIVDARSEHALHRLRDLAAPSARAWRDGVLRIVPAVDLVPGDAVGLETGDVVPADVLLLDGSGLRVDESVLTGESQPVQKIPQGGAEAGQGYAGTTVLAGRATATVVATGRSTRYGQIAALVAHIRPQRTPLERAIRRLVLRLGALALILCGIVVFAERLHGSPWSMAVIAGVSLAIASVPEEFPTVYTLYLSLGAWRLARHHALVRHLAAVETLGSVSVLCLDKTGTMTIGELVVRDAWAVTGNAVDHLDPGEAGASELLVAARRAADVGSSDAFDVAIVRYTRSVGIPDPEASGAELVRIEPFDPRRRSTAVVWRLPNGRGTVYAKGALDSVLDRCRVNDAVRAEALAAETRLTEPGFRVLAIAEGDLGEAAPDDVADEKALALVGLLAFDDAVRDSVPTLLGACREAGVRVMMITGDAPGTAAAVARAVGLPLGPEGAPVAGGGVRVTSDSQLLAIVGRANVFARIEPSEKYRIIRALQARGEVVAMTGDGVNDAPALRMADIGVALGRRGTPVAGQAASLVLLDDELATIVAAIRDGRRIFDNLRMAFSYLIAFHVPLLLTAFVLPLAGAPLLLLPVQLAWFELIVHPTAALVFDSEPPAPGAMARPPRGRRRGILEGADLAGPFMLGLVLVVAVLALYLGALRSGASHDVARTMGVAALLIGQVGLVLSARAGPRPMWQVPIRANPLLLPMLGATLASLLVAVSVPAVRAVLHLAPMGMGQWGLALMSAVVGIGWREPVKAWRAHHWS